MSTALVRPLREIAPGHYETPAIHINIVVQIDPATLLLMQRTWAQHDLELARRGVLECQHLRDSDRLEIERERLAVEKEKVAVLKSIDAKLERLFWAQG
jgi:hypothetical protein